MQMLLKLITSVIALLAISSSALAADSSFPDGYFKATTQFRESSGECLEGNQAKGSMNGAAFMDKCQNVSGQLWKATPKGNGYYTLTTQFRNSNGECLEGNQAKGSMNGAAFMDKCQNVSGQLWKFTSAAPAAQPAKTAAGDQCAPMIPNNAGAASVCGPVCVKVGLQFAGNWSNEGNHPPVAACAKQGKGQSVCGCK